MGELICSPCENWESSFSAWIWLIACFLVCSELHRLEACTFLRSYFWSAWLSLWAHTAELKLQQLGWSNRSSFPTCRRLLARLQVKRMMNFFWKCSDAPWPWFGFVARLIFVFAHICRNCSLNLGHCRRRHLHFDFDWCQEQMNHCCLRFRRTICG